MRSKREFNFRILGIYGFLLLGFGGIVAFSLSSLQSVITIHQDLRDNYETSLLDADKLLVLLYQKTPGKLKFTFANEFPTFYEELAISMRRFEDFLSEVRHRGYSSIDDEALKQTAEINEGHNRSVVEFRDRQLAMEPIASLRAFLDGSLEPKREELRNRIEKLRQIREKRLLDAMQVASSNVEKIRTSIGVLSGTTTATLIALGTFLLLLMRENRRFDDRLMESESRHRLIVNAAGDGIVLLDHDLRVQYANDAFCKLSQYPCSHLQGRLIKDFIEVELKSHFPDEEHGEGELELKRRDGSTAWALVSQRRIQIGGSSAESVVMVVSDITKRKQVENALRSLAMKQQKTQEEERRRISREIHDDLGQQLTVLKMELFEARKLRSTMSETASSKLDENLAHCLNSVDQMIVSVRSLASDLRPTILEDLGLVAATNWLIQKFRRASAIDIRFEENLGNRPISEEVATAAFRILQEALTNAIRHSKTKVIDVKLLAAEDAIHLKVRDFGEDLAAKTFENTATLGIFGMKERTEQFGGSFSLKTQEGGGKEVLVTMPLDLGSSLA